MNEVATVGKPSGPKVYVPELGCEVPTWTETPPGPKVLMHHVPLNKRGPFRPEQLANFDLNKQYRTDKLGYVLCYATAGSGKICGRKATNMVPRCILHGGKVHPLDRTVDPEPENVETKPLTRYQQFLAKQLTVEDLDDEEVLNFGFRMPNGSIYRPRNIPREFVNEITKAIYDRALHEIKSNAVEAAKTLASIMVDPANDASIRLKAAESILDRSIGKAPQQLNITAGAPWEEIFESISTATREQSRAARRNVIDADVIPENGSAALSESPGPPADGARAGDTPNGEH